MGRAESGGDGRLDVLLGDAHRFSASSSPPMCLGGASDWQARRRFGPGVCEPLYFYSFWFPEIIPAEHSCNILLFLREP